jgi:hypothetical protein
MRTWPSRPARRPPRRSRPCGTTLAEATVLDLHRGWRWVGRRMPPLIEVLDERWILPASGPSLERPLMRLMTSAGRRTALQRQRSATVPGVVMANDDAERRQGSRSSSANCSRRARSRSPRSAVGLSSTWIVIGIVRVGRAMEQPKLTCPLCRAEVPALGSGASHQAGHGEQRETTTCPECGALLTRPVEPPHAAWYAPETSGE